MAAYESKSVLNSPRRYLSSRGICSLSKSTTTANSMINRYAESKMNYRPKYIRTKER
ncbi:MAG TPA: hypothetical protein VED22_01270 [Nitrososphaerales archaeon]|nr:hypothetical protein [Nitrososphaerales archaeon]